MLPILIDYKTISKSTLINRIEKISDTSNTSIILFLDDKDVKKLEKSKDKISMLDKIDFYFYYYVIYYKDKNICIISYETYKHINDILPTLFSGFTPKTKLWVNVELENNNFMHIIDIFSKNGFNNPYLTKFKPNNTEINLSISLSRQNTPTEKYIAKSTMNKILYALKQYKKSSCSVHIQLDKKAISFLRKASKIGITLNKNGKKSQKELTGELIVKEVIKKNNKFIYIIDIDEGSVRSGEEEEVDVSATRYNFHSHPQEAYIRHSVDNAWPSVTDYLGYLQLGNNTIFHIVATLEGVYIMSFNSYWGKRLKKIEKSFVKKRYDIDHKRDYTPNSYVKKVNSILYKGYPIYNVQFFNWESANKVFEVSYSKSGINCFATQKGIKTYKELHSE